MVDITKNPAYVQKYTPGVPVTAASFLVTEWCNLNCTYCYEKETHRNVYMDIPTATAAYDFLFNNALKSNAKKEVHIMFFGGEPTLNPDILDFCYTYGLKKREETGIPISYSIVTNATNLNDRVYSIFEKYINSDMSFNMQLSIDGIREVQNMYRVTKSGSGSFDMIEANIPKFKKLFEKKPRVLSVHGCLNKNSLPYMFDNYVFFREQWGIENIWFLPVMEEDWVESDVDMYDKMFGKIYDYILKVVKATQSNREAFNYSPLDKMYGVFNKKSKPCGAGNDYMTITAIGEIYPCHQIYFQDPNKQTICGNIYTGVDDDKRRIFLEYQGDDLSCDSDCPHNSCYRCLAVNWISNGSILSQLRGLYCKMMKIDLKYQRMMKKELANMGITNNNAPNNQTSTDENVDCLCKYRGSEFERKLAMEADGLKYTPSTDNALPNNDSELTSTQNNSDENVQIISIDGDTVKFVTSLGHIGTINIHEFERQFGPIQQNAKSVNDIPSQNTEKHVCGCDGECVNKQSSGISDDILQTISSALNLLLKKMDNIEKKIGA